MDRDQAHTQNELLKRIAIALEKSNVTKAVELSGQRNKELSAKGILDSVKVITDDYASKQKDIPGFEGTLDALENLTNMTEARDYYKEKYENTLTPTSDNPDPAGYSNAYETDLQGIKVDSDHDIRSTAAYYEYEELDTGATKKDCILDYVTNEFGALGARYTDIIKFAYYLGDYNKLKYTSEDRGYYACAFATRYGGHLIQGGKDQLVKGINKEGNERYFALSFVDEATGFWKYIK